MKRPKRCFIVIIKATGEVIHTTSLPKVAEKMKRTSKTLNHYMLGTSYYDCPEFILARVTTYVKCDANNKKLVPWYESPMYKAYLEKKKAQESK